MKNNNIRYRKNYFIETNYLVAILGRQLRETEESDFLTSVETGANENNAKRIKYTSINFNTKLKTRQNVKWKLKRKTENHMRSTSISSFGFKVVFFFQKENQSASYQNQFYLGWPNVDTTHRMVELDRVIFFFVFCLFSVF